MSYQEIQASDVMDARYMRENDIKPTRVARIPYTECCGRMPWDCDCAWSCLDCKTVHSGQGGCGCYE